MTIDHAAEALNSLELADIYGEDGAHQSADRCLTAALVHATRALVGLAQPAPLVVYRAESSGITLGHYATREQARAHCVADADQADLTDLRWVTDTGVHDNPEADELWGISGSDSEPMELDFRVTPITVQAAYDPETEG